MGIVKLTFRNVIEPSTTSLLRNLLRKYMGIIIKWLCNLHSYSLCPTIIVARTVMHASGLASVHVQQIDDVCAHKLQRHSFRDRGSIMELHGKHLPHH
jgi:hypothetical protein